MEKLIFPSNILIRIKKKIKETKSRCKKSKQVHWNTVYSNKIEKCKKKTKQMQIICWGLMQNLTNTTIPTTKTISYSKHNNEMCNAQAKHSSKKHICFNNVVQCKPTNNTTKQKYLHHKDKAQTSLAKQNNVVMLQCVSLLQHDFAVKMR